MLTGKGGSGGSSFSRRSIATSWQLYCPKTLHEVKQSQWQSRHCQSLSKTLSLRSAASLKYVSVIFRIFPDETGGFYL